VFWMRADRCAAALPVLHSAHCSGEPRRPYQLLKRPVGIGAPNGLLYLSVIPLRPSPIRGRQYQQGFGINSFYGSAGYAWYSALSHVVSCT